MRHINLNKFREKVEAFGWETIKQTQIVAMTGMTVVEKKEYIRTHPVWNELQPIMLELSNNKCWYSDSPIGNSDFEVDHFRPKSESKEKIDYNNPKSKSTILKENGYWWLAYNWDNFRLAGAYANKLRRDRLQDNADVKGKGAYFPLDLINGRVANDEEDCSCEVPILLDPLEPDDVCLLTFDKGIAIPATTDGDEIDRVKKTIFYYHLDLDQLEKDRKITWDDCVEQIEDAKKAIDSTLNFGEKKSMMKKCFKELRKLVDPEKRSFTSTAKACLMVYSELSGYEWLKNLLRTI